MNDRIKQLVEQANRYALDKANEGEDEDFDYSFDDDFQEKFAELIVKECANHCDLLLDHKISSEWSRGTHDCSRAIKQHFGVEE